MRGKLFLIVGASGVGKDTLIDGARAELADDADFFFCRRVITRPADAGGEDHEPATPDAFVERASAGEFFVMWDAHGHSYGVPLDILDHLQAGRNVVLNASRRKIAEIAELYPRVEVLNITASPETVAQRLMARGREDAEAVAMRLARQAPLPNAGVPVVNIPNDGTVEEGMRRLLAALLGAIDLPLTLKRAAIDMWREPICLLHAKSRMIATANLNDAAMVEIFNPDRSVRARLAIASDEAIVGQREVALSSLAFDVLGLPESTEVQVRRSPSPMSRDVLRKKVAGNQLAVHEIERVVRDLVEGRYSSAEVAGFLVAAAKNLSIDEVTALTRARAHYAHRFQWDRQMVVDKHSMGGVPGSRISMIVVPIVAAHGLIIPKTSSRAITSAAGTADAMETIARVDLEPNGLKAVISAAGGSIVWNGRINHSRVDDVMNAINRPLGIASAKLDVSSILSKKLAMGSTHVAIDIPVGPCTKVKDRARGEELAELFETVGRGVGLTVKAVLTNGATPVGSGIGPALEVRDVYKVLRNAPDAPADLRKKALQFAGMILEWDPAMPAGTGFSRAEMLLLSGAALAALETIVESQGRVSEPENPGLFTREIMASRAGLLSTIDCFAVAGIARAAGAPGDKGAGVDVLKSVGDLVKEGEPVLRVHTSAESGLELAAPEIDKSAAFSIA